MSDELKEALDRDSGALPENAVPTVDAAVTTDNAAAAADSNPAPAEAKPGLLRSVCVTTAIALAVILLWLLIGGAFRSSLSAQERVKKFSDAFFAVGALLFCFGLLLWVAGEGVFDLLSYGVRMIFRVKFDGRYETYHEYRERKHAGGPKRMPLGIIIPGALLTAVAIVFAVLFEHV